jgi:hypothetical protein
VTRQTLVTCLLLIIPYYLLSVHQDALQQGCVCVWGVRFFPFFGAQLRRASKYDLPFISSTCITTNIQSPHILINARKYFFEPSKKFELFEKPSGSSAHCATALPRVGPQSKKLLNVKLANNTIPLHNPRNNNIFH